MTDREAALIAAAKPFWDAEAEITRRFFAGPPSRDDYIHYLRSAVYKELNPAIGYGPTDGYANGLHMEFCDIVERFRGLDAEIDRRDMLASLKMMTEEFEHYVVLAEVLEFVLGRRLAPEDAQQLPEDVTLNEMRRRYVESGDPCLVAAMGLTEGGGASTFREASRLSGGKLEQRLAAAMKLIHDDEKDHYEDAAADAARAVRSDNDLERMKRAIREVSIQRVRMRNEQFRFQMSEEEIEALIAANPL
ncbi:MAG: hypothetical protein OXI22_05095 [Defluviicoccus sp.]|nr:hypothetical protein [Defluviicoccus sp.]MDE0383239.1 hypothetical protein [Defluviicoccus sp.]